MYKLLLLSQLSLAAMVSAAVITPGFTYAVANSGGGSNGSHFHSNTGGSFGNPAGKAEVGHFSTEEVRGLSEYDLTGLSSATDAFVTFNVFQMGGLFPGVNDFPFSGMIDVYAYDGNNLEDIADFQAASLGLVGSFSTAGLSVGDVISLPITAIFNGAITGGNDSLGIRLQIAPGTNTGGGAVTLDTFRLTTDDQTTGETPEPTTAALLAAGMAGLWVFRRRR